jgi:hypothetical protein
MVAGARTQRLYANLLLGLETQAGPRDTILHVVQEVCALVPWKASHVEAMAHIQPALSQIHTQGESTKAPPFVGRASEDT